MIKCPNCENSLVKTVDGHEYELTENEVDFAKELEPYPTQPDTMRIKAAMFELKCKECQTEFTYCISCKRLMKRGDLHRITKPKWEQYGRRMVQMDGVYAEYMRCPFCGYSVGGYREKYVGESGEEENFI